MSVAKAACIDLCQADNAAIVHGRNQIVIGDIFIKTAPLGQATRFDLPGWSQARNDF